MHLAVIGASHVGLVASAGFADFGNDVVCVVDDPARVARLDAGELDLYEPGLTQLIVANAASGRIRFSTDLEAAVKAAEVIIIALDVARSVQGEPELKPLFQVADRIATIINKHKLSDYKVIVTKSTVPVGTSDRLKVRIGARTAWDFGVVSNPSFLKEGDAVNGFMKPDRVLIGTNDESAAELLRRLYAPFVRTRDRIFVSDTRSAELAKYATSALLASRVSFMNDLAILADELGADIEAVRKVMGADPRIGEKYLFVGPGFGGSQLQGDIAMLLYTAREVGRELRLVTATDAVNRQQKGVLLQRLRHGLSGNLTGKTVCVWGLAYKPRTADIGESPALALIDGLLEAGALVQVHDPRAMDNVAAIYGDRIRCGESMYDAATGADALALVTEWHQYRRPDFKRLRAILRGNLLLDGRNIWDPTELRDLGFRYVGIGRGILRSPSVAPGPAKKETVS